jgi:pimeloyl-ACP methyl ester carboxylesterase
MYLKEVAPLLFAERTLVEKPDLVEATYKRSMGFDRRGVSRAGLAVVVHRTSILEKLGRIYAPTLVMCGSEDKAQPVARHEAIVSRIPGAKLAVLDGLGHMSPLEDSNAVNAQLVPFVKDLITR